MDNKILIINLAHQAAPVVTKQTQNFAGGKDRHDTFTETASFHNPVTVHYNNVRSWSFVEDFLRVVLDDDAEVYIPKVSILDLGVYNEKNAPAAKQ